MSGQCPASMRSSTAPNEPTRQIAGPLSDRKTRATLQSRAAHTGWTLATVADPAAGARYSLSRWGCVLTLPNLAAVAHHLPRMGAPE
jgi:hypothetical protein